MALCLGLFSQCQQHNTNESSASSLFAAAQQLENTYQYPEGISTYAQAARLAKDSSQWHLFIQASHGAARLGIEYGKDSLVKHLLYEALQRQKELPPSADSLLVDTYRLLGLFWDYESRGDTSRVFYDLAVAKAKALPPNHYLKVAAYAARSAHYSRYTKYSLGMEDALKAAAIGNHIYEHHPLVAADAYNALGMALFYNSSYKLAERFLQRSIDMYEQSELGSSANKAKTLANMAILADLMGNSAKAQEYYKRTLQAFITSAGPEHPSLATYYRSIANFYTKHHNYDSALHYIKEGYAIREKAFGQQDLLVSNFKYSLVTTLRLQKKYDSALLVLNQVMAQGKQQTATANIRSYRLRIKALIQHDQQQYDSALLTLQQCFHLINPTYPEANWQQPLAIGPNTQNKTQIVRLLADKALMLQNYHQASMNTSYAQLANQLFGQMDSLITYFLLEQMDDPNRQNVVSAKVLQIFDQALQSDLKAWQNWQANACFHRAFYWAERSHALALQVSQSRTNQNNAANDTTVQKGLTLAEELIALEGKARRGNLQTQNLAELDSQFFALATQLTTYRWQRSQQSTTTSPEARALLAEPASIKSLQAALAQDQALLEYHMGSENTVLFIITQDTTLSQALGNSQKIKALAKDFHTNITTSYATDESATLGHTLYQELLEPVAPLLANYPKLVIIPSNEIAYIPMEALLTRAPEQGSSPQYLFKTHALQYHLSATLWLMGAVTKRSPKALPSILAMAPVFPDSLTEAETSTRTTKTKAMPWANLPELAESKTEAREIADLFTAHGSSATLLLGNQATEANFKQQGGRHDIVHIATHSRVDWDRPNLSAIIFAQGTQTGSNKEDGILYAGETYLLERVPDLLVLSSCESGLGKLMRGEGFVSLARGFVHSGAQNIIFSLWQVEDKPTRLLMHFFYQELLAGHPYPEALNKAKLQLVSLNPEYNHPKYWAGFVLLGQN